MPISSSITGAKTLLSSFSQSSISLLVSVNQSYLVPINSQVRPIKSLSSGFPGTDKLEGVSSFYRSSRTTSVTRNVEDRKTTNPSAFLVGYPPQKDKRHTPIHPLQWTQDTQNKGTWLSGCGSHVPSLATHNHCNWCSPLLHKGILGMENSPCNSGRTLVWSSQ